MALRDALRSGVQRTAMAAMLGVERFRTGVAYNPLDLRNRNAPDPRYRRLREKDPRHESKLVGGCVFSRYDDIVGVLQDGRFQVDRRKLPVFEKRRDELIRAGALEP